ncbi:MAG: HAMP domain-containing protein [Pirellulales bacterium]
MKRFSIRWRITLWNTAAFAIVLLGFGILVYVLLRQTHYDQVDRLLRSRATELVDEAGRGTREQRFQSLVHDLSGHLEMLGVVTDAKGNVLAHADQLESTTEQVVPERVDSTYDFDSITLPGLGHMRRLAAAVSIDGAPYKVVLLADLEHVDEELALVIKSLMLTAPITLAVAAGLAYLLARKALAPVEQLRQLADEITAARLDRRLPVSNSADELGLLAQTINSMIGRLEQSFEEVRRSPQMPRTNCGHPFQ